MERSPLARRLTDIAGWGLALAGVGATIAFFAVDQRPPADLGHYFRELPETYRALGDAERSVWPLVGHVGGLQQLLTAVVLRVFGRGAGVFEAIDVGWMALLVLSQRGIAARLGGSMTALCAVVLTVSMAAFHIGARSHWLHFVEAAVTMATVYAWVADRELERWRTRLALFIGALFLLSLRPTGMLYALPLLAFSAWTAGLRRIGRWGIGALALIPGALVLRPQMAIYMEGKADAQGFYEGVVVPVHLAVMQQALFVPMLLVGAGLVLALGRRRLGLRAEWLLFGCWIAGSLLVSSVSNAGVDNFLVLFAAAALLAAPGLASLFESARWRVGLGIGLGVGLSLTAMAAPFLPQPVAHRMVPAFGVDIVTLDALNYLRPQPDALTLGHLEEAFAGVCTEGEHCEILISRGLFNLNREDDSALALFLASLDTVQLHNSGQWWFPYNLERAGELDGLAMLECRGAEGPSTVFSEREHALFQLSKLVESTSVAFIEHPAPCPIRFFAIEDQGDVIVEFARSFPWKHHALVEPPQDRERTRPRRPPSTD